MQHSVLAIVDLISYIRGGNRTSLGSVVRGVVSVDTEEIPTKRVSAWLGCQVHCHRPSIWIEIRGTNVVCALRGRADERYILHR